MKAQKNPIQRFRSDNEGEFDPVACKKWMQTEGIQWEPTTTYKPHQNAVTKRYFPTIFARTQALLYDAGLSNNQWGKAISTAVYLKNRSQTKSLKRINPYESDTGGKPDLSTWRNFGYVAYNHNDDPKRRKFRNQGIQCVFLDYEGRNQYRLWDFMAHKVVQSSHADREKLEAPSILSLGQVELELYDSDSEIDLSSHIWSAFTKFFRSNGSDRGTVDDGDHNIAIDTVGT